MRERELLASQVWAKLGCGPYPRSRQPTAPDSAQTLAVWCHQESRGWGGASQNNRKVGGMFSPTSHTTQSLTSLESAQTLYQVADSLAGYSLHRVDHHGVQKVGLFHSPGLMPHRTCPTQEKWCLQYGRMTQHRGSQQFSPLLSPQSHRLQSLFTQL